MHAQDDLFNTKITYIVEEKWNRHYNVIVRQTYLFMIYIIILTLHLSIMIESKAIVFLVLVFQLFFLFYEELIDMI